jgi:hypothetical protein
MGGVARRATEQARVQVFVGGFDDHLGAEQAAQPRGDGRRLASHILVSQTSATSAFRSSAWASRKPWQRWAAGFLLALKDDGDRDRQLPVASMQARQASMKVMI